VRYQLLGPLAILGDDDRSVPLAGGRERVLLATLALSANQVVSTGRLIGALWGEDPPATATNALQVHVSKLRKKLGGDTAVISSAPNGYALVTEPGSVDAIQFETLVAGATGDRWQVSARLAEALALWRGPALGDVRSDLLEGERVRLEELRSRALERRIDADLDLGRHAEVLGELEALVHADPFRERPRGQLMVALYRSGRQADALSTYNEAKALLADELGIDPGPELQSLELAVLNQGPELVAPVRTEPSPVAQGPPRQNLPVQFTSFIGRDAEVTEVLGLLAASRLVTLTGPGGCGKTRLGIQTAAKRLDGSGDGVWFVDLATLRDERFVPERLASVLGVRAEPNTEVVDSLAASISDRSMLVVLDNCEHLVDACAKLSDRLLRSCPGLVILATSREPLGVAGEHPYRVPSLGLPADDAAGDAERVARCEAVQLLVERARVHDPTFAVTDANAEAVASICERLDGMPLALELVAARLSVLTPKDVERRLDDRLRLLTGSSRTTLPRQQTLQASLDWSFDLLDPSQQAALLRLSVFVGSFEFTAAESVCAAHDTGTGQVAELLFGLVDRSLVRALQSDGSRRLRLDETVREYATRKLLDAGDLELAAARERHAAHYDSVARDLPTKGDLRPMTVANALTEEHRYALETGNVRAALEHSLHDADDVDRSLRLAALYSWCGGVTGAVRNEYLRVLEPHLTRLAHGDPWWQARVEEAVGTSLRMSGRFTEGVPHLEKAKTIGVASDNLFTALSANRSLIYHAFRQGNLVMARSLGDEGVALAEASDEPDLVAYAKYARGKFSSPPDLHGGNEDLRRAAEHFHRHGYEAQYWDCIANLGTNELLAGELASAREHFECYLGSGAVSNDLIAITHLNLAELCICVGDVDGAAEHWCDGASLLERNRMAGYYWNLLIGGALCCSAAGAFVTAVRLHGAATQSIEESDEEFEPFEAALRGSDLVKLRSAIGEEDFDREFAKGRSMTFEAATTLCRDALRRS
jgi:predicted ATPase/DNA-binding SARP family transcriptional activator